MRSVACILLFSAASGVEALPAQLGWSADVVGSGRAGTGGREGPDGEGWKTEPTMLYHRQAPK